MKYFNYKKTFELMCAFGALNDSKTRIIRYLFYKNIFYGNYTDLTVAIGMDKKNMNNIRKAVIELNKIGIVCIDYANYVEHDEKGNCINKVARMKYYYLVDNWMENLINWYYK